MKWINNVFGFMVKQPLNITLQQMKVTHIMALYVTFCWTDELLNKIPALHQNSDAVIVGVYFTNFVALVAVFWKAINDIRKPHD